MTTGYYQMRGKQRSIFRTLATTMGQYCQEETTLFSEHLLRPTIGQYWAGRKQHCSLNTCYNQADLFTPDKYLEYFNQQKKCNLRPKSVICGEHPSGIIQHTQPQWHNEILDNCVHNTTCVLKNKFSKWGGLSVGGVDLSFICGHNFQASGQYPGNRNCVRNTTRVHNKAIIIIMEIFKLPTYQKCLWQNQLLQGAGSIQLSFHTFWHRLPWLAISSCLQPVFCCCFLMKNPLTLPDVDARSAMFL